FCGTPLGALLRGGDAPFQVPRHRLCDLLPDTFCHGLTCILFLAKKPQSCLGEICSGIERVDGSISRLLDLLFVSVSISFSRQVSRNRVVMRCLLLSAK